jgi:hypothetical protein
MVFGGRIGLRICILLEAGEQDIHPLSILEGGSKGFRVRLTPVHHEIL